ncbi:MAG: nuclear transport factor 2 family protein [Planctomycetes bacterium]|nr:nuclear transport factor 2 family protein [Planctomycetota bacterium]
MKKIAIGIACVVAAFLLGGMLVDLFKSDEDQIRSVVSRMVTGFNDAAPKRAVGGLAKDFRDPATGFNREQIQEAIRFLVLRNQGKLPWSCQIADDLIDVSVDGDTATARFGLRFLEKRGDARESVWTLSIDAELRRNDEGWVVVKANRQTTEGNRPF